MRIKHNGLEYEVHAILVDPSGLSYFIEDQDYGFTFVGDRNIIFIDNSMPGEWSINAFHDYLSGMYIIGPPCITESIESFEGCVEHFYASLEQLKIFAKREETRKLEDFFSHCFPENWSQRGLDWRMIVEEYFKQASSKGYLASVTGALKHYYNACERHDDRDIEEELLLKYGCFYWPSEEGHFVKPWLAQLIQMLVPHQNQWVKWWYIRFFQAYFQ